MSSSASTQSAKERERLFRRFQIEKFSRSRSVPCVSMTVDIRLAQLQKQRKHGNDKLPPDDRISMTHVLIKAVAMTLRDFPDLYSFFDGRKVVSSRTIKINLPVAEGDHVEYVVIQSPESKSLQQIAVEVRDEVTRIRAGEGTFYLRLKKLFRLPRFLRLMITNCLPINIRLASKSYGNFPVTNFGSFGVKNGAPILSAPMIAVLCFGMIQNVPCGCNGNEIMTEEVLPVTLVVDHRPIDGAYGGRFLSQLKALIETDIDPIFA